MTMTMPALLRIKCVRLCGTDNTCQKLFFIISPPLSLHGYQIFGKMPLHKRPKYSQSLFIRK